MNKQKIIAVVLVAISAIVAVLSFFILPETVVIQLSLGSSGNATAPKLLAILIPALLGIGGAVIPLFSERNDKASNKSLIISVVGIFVGILSIVVNSVI